MYFYRTGQDALPNGESVETLVNSAILRVYTGERRWDPDERPDLLIHLKGIVKSLLWHLLESSDNRLLDAEPEEPEDDEDKRGWSARQEYETAAWQSSGWHTPLGLLLESERQIVGARAMELLLEECGKDKVLLDIIQLMRERITKPGLLAQNLGLQTKEIYVAIKRLERKFRATTQRVKEELAVGSCA